MMRMKTRLVASATVTAALVVAAFVILLNWGGSLGVLGPKERSVVVEGAPTPVETYAQGGRSRLAVLLTGTDKGWGWLAFAHALKSWGVPFVLTRDWREAAAHRVVVVFPDLTDAELPAEARTGLEAAVRGGTTLIAVNPSAASWKDVFGYQEAKFSRARGAWRFRPAIRELAPFTHPKELTIPLTWLTEGRDLDTAGYSGAAEPPLADFEDGSAAMLRRHLGRGAAYAVGLDLGQLMHVSHSLRDERIERSYVNDYEPAADVFMRLIAELYRRGEPAAATLGTVPMGKALSVLVTHDIDYLHSVRNSAVYEDYERQAGIPATYFLQTKYVTDSSEKAWFAPENLALMRQIAEAAPELASHSVAHSLQYAKFPMGDGRERYPSYRPRVIDLTRTDGGTILGELRVSKFLIEALLGVPPIVSFRPGHLSDPYSLPQALRAAGYLYNSASTANNSLTHLPYRLTESRESRVETPLYEFPVTVEDEESPDLRDRLPQALTLAETLSGYGGLFVILIHPDVIAGKLEFEKGFITAWKDRAWFGTLSQMGAWWAARDAVEVDADAAAKTVTVSATTPIDGLLLHTPAGWKFDHVESSDATAEPISDGLLLRRLHGTYILHFL